MDARNFDYKTLTELRKRSVGSLQEGQSPEIVVKALGIDRGTMYRLFSRYRQGGRHGLDANTRGGKKTKLDDKAMRWMYKTIIG